MPEPKIDSPRVLNRMTQLRTEFDDIIKELEMLSNPQIRRQMRASLKAERQDRTKKYTLTELKKAIGL